jgi:hypothetical protein
VVQRHLRKSPLLLDNLPSLFTRTLLFAAIHVELSGVGVCVVVLTISLDVLDELSDSEQIVHAFQRQSFRLRNQEPHEDKHGEAERAVCEESTGITLAMFPFFQ